MLQLLQRDIRSKNSRDTLDQSRGAEVAVGECLGRAGCGAVFRGTWHRVPVAVKVMQTRNDGAQALQDAVEMAVLSSVQHPNIVQVFACLTDMVKTTDNHFGGRSASFTGGVKTHYRRLRPEEDPDEAVTHNIIVMEPCDRGTLRDAIKGGLLHQSLPDGAIGIKLAPAAELLLDVAYAVQYLHSMQLVHGDLRELSAREPDGRLALENVLLKTDRSRPLGATPKLSEFGLTRILSDADHAAGAAPPGGATCAHVAPEMFRAGCQVSTAVDAYAFGVFMWEVYTSKRAFSGLPREAVIERVSVKGARPRFPSTTPPAFAELAQACWAADPAARPSFTQIAEALDRLVGELSGRPI
ncbi:Mitogen-activated protein kinase kinase kinase 9 [Monoraphidium neglectum]|uniref:Mitogen-activated protein kinase kinase kinase 9 n=1 Tax=Monoraphidium neglectum TaxID=145388 RepID=A0A0D2J346_9CHLO|nr:Mitogen-activated protein kinase kinase kinase 9 [Monoraphidium neglectum]KIY94397.1 Mitogen-activated protein kinase kinase kinase 9 [Monoraphidium neglectum]|eukprot:XP_013893417.1 Mitogen-activated protein kinase kinase kinase 9 [Monoraphidium neglectum]